MIPTVYLSENGIEEAFRVFDLLKSDRPVDDRFDFTAVDWNDFDQIYLHLYRLSLLHRDGWNAKANLPIRNDDRFAKVRSTVTKDDRIVQVECILDIHLEGEDTTRHLLSEFAVHSLIGFRNAFVQTVRLQTSVTYVDVGCIMMGFGVRLPKAAKLAAFRQEDADDVARKLVKERLSTKRWTDIKHRYCVRQSYVDGVPF